MLNTPFASVLHSRPSHWKRVRQTTAAPVTGPSNSSTTVPAPRCPDRRPSMMMSPTSVVPPATAAWKLRFASGARDSVRRNDHHDIAEAGRHPRNVEPSVAAGDRAEDASYRNHDSLDRRAEIIDHPADNGGEILRRRQGP